MPDRPPTAAPRRLSRAQRRDQLLDSAAAMLVERGLAQLTMEGVAAQAGVSKALPYSHFENANEMLMALRARELDRVAESVVTSVASTTGYEAKLAAAVHGYFEFIEHRGAMLVALLRSIPMDEAEQRKRYNPAFFARIFERELGFSEPLARVTSAIFVSGISGAIDAWDSGVADRATIEATVVRAMLGGAAAVAAAERSGEITTPPPPT